METIYVDDRSLRGVIGPNNEPLFRYLNNFSTNFSDIYIFGLNFSFCTNISMVSSSFEASMVWIFEASGTIYIDQVHFLSISDYDLRSGISLATGLIINQTKTKGETFVMVKVINSLFSQSESLNSSNNLLLFYIFINDPGCIIQVVVNQTNFSSISYDPGWAAEHGMIWIMTLSSRDTYIEFNGVKFLSNNFQPDILPYPFNALYRFAGMLSITSENFVQRVKIESCIFLNNDANRIISFEGDIF